MQSAHYQQFCSAHLLPVMRAFLHSSIRCTDLVITPRCTTIGRAHSVHPSSHADDQRCLALCVLCIAYAVRPSLEIPTYGHLHCRSVCIPLPAPCDDVHCLVRVLPPLCSPSRPISLSMDSRICSLAIIRSASHAVDTVGCHYVQISSAHLF